MELHTTTIDGKKISISKFGAIEGWRLVHKLASIAGPSIASIAKEDFKGAVGAIFEKCDEDQFLELLQKLTGMVMIDDKPTQFGVHFTNHMFTFKVCAAVLEHNFSDFFSPIKEAMADLLKKQSQVD